MSTAFKAILRLSAMTCLFLPALPSAARPDRPADHPNIVILFVDQLRWSEVGCYGNEVIRTPNLDRLARESVRFTHAFTNFPSCSPARSTILSGRHARSNGVYANQNKTLPVGRPTNREITLPETLAVAGYTTTLIGNLYSLYYGQVTGVDDWVGRVLESIKDLGLEDNTIVLFSSDHGDLLGSHQMFNKNSHYDEACRIPLLVRWPGKIKPAVQDKQIVSLVDVMPTLLALCGVDIPGTVQGDSLAPVLLGRKETVGENVAYIETTINEGVRTMNHVYWCSRKSFDKEHLFDIDKDPYQMKDVIADPSYKDVAAKLRAMTRTWRERTPSVQAAEEAAISRPG